MQLQSCYQMAATAGVKALIYGAAGAGKTRLCATAPAPVILSVESGLLTLKKVIADIRIQTGNPAFDIPVYEITSVADLMDAYNMFASNSQDVAFCQTVCLDSISEIAELVLKEELGKTSHGQQAYGKYNTALAEILRAFRGLQGRHVYFSAKDVHVKDETTGLITTRPHVPGKVMLNDLPFFFDEVFYLHTITDPKGVEYRALRTSGNANITAKDRGGYLDPIEPHADLTYLFGKILQP